MAKVEVFAVPGVDKAWRFVCPCCNGLHALSEAQVKGEAFYCRQQDVIGNPKENEVDAYLDAMGMIDVPKCNIGKRADRADYNYDPYAY